MNNDLKVFRRSFFNWPGLIFLVLFVSIGVSGQTALTWEQLAQVTFQEVDQENAGAVFARAQFSKSLLKREGQDVFIIGYLLPLDVRGNAYALSASPFAACFFCGKSGPETVMELEFAKKESWFAIDQLVMVHGKIRFNPDNPERLYYILQQAAVMERMDK